MDGADSYDNGGDSPWANSSPGGEEERRPNKEKKSNALPLWGNDRTMNMNPLILTNIQSSSYFKVNLYDLKTYHEVVDEIFYKVTHLEPWEKGSRKTAGQTGMCGGEVNVICQEGMRGLRSGNVLVAVRGVGAGGIVSTAYCLLYKLFTLKLTRKQVNGLLTHHDSPYIRGLGFMYIRYTQPPADLWDWYDGYLEDPETMDVKAGGGQVMAVGDMLRAFLTKLEWFSTLFPRIPVPIQQMLQRKMAERFPPAPPPPPPSVKPVKPRHIPDEEVSYGEAERFSKQRRPDSSAVAGRGMERDRRRGSPDRDRKSSPDRRPGHSPDKRDRRRERPSSRDCRDRSREKLGRSGGSHSSRDSHRSRDHDPKRSRHSDDHPAEDARDRHSGDRHRHNGKSRHRHR